MICTLSCVRVDAVPYPGGRFPQGTGEIFLDNIMCSGLEVNILSCDYDPPMSCTHADDAGVGCRVESKKTIGEWHFWGMTALCRGRSRNFSRGEGAEKGGVQPLK